MNIILVGFKNAGKTTLGKQLAERLRWSFADTDELIKDLYNHVQGTQLSIPEIFRREQTLGFRAWERNAIESLAGVKHTIIATGGGSVLSQDNINLLKKVGKIIYLQASAEELFKRQTSNTLPEFIDKQNAHNDFLKIFAEREAIYASIADAVILTQDKDSVDIIMQILEFILRNINI